MKHSLLLIPLLFFIFPNAIFASTSKDGACAYPEGIYQESLEVAGLKNASVSEFHKRDYYDHSELWYIVRQSNMYKPWTKSYDDYSVYSYNCKTKKPRRVLWQMTLRKIVSKVPSNQLFKDAKIVFIWGRYIVLSWYMDKQACTDKSCDSEFYNSTINLSPHTFTIAKRIPVRWPNEYDTIWTYTY